MRDVSPAGAAAEALHYNAGSMSGICEPALFGKRVVLQPVQKLPAEVVTVTAA